MHVIKFLLLNFSNRAVGTINFEKLFFKNVSPTQLVDV